jgi:hypothetical protein
MRAKAPAGMLNLDCVDAGQLWASKLFALRASTRTSRLAVNHGVKRDGFDNGHPTGVGLSYLSLLLSPVGHRTCLALLDSTARSAVPLLYALQSRFR